MSKKKNTTKPATIPLVEPKAIIPMTAGRGASQKAEKAARSKAARPDDDKVSVAVLSKSKSKATKNAGKRGMSGLDAAAKVLADAGKPLTSQEIVNAMASKGLWKTSGKTPHATIYAAIIREIAKKGSAGRFRKTDRGHFTVAKTK